MPESKPRKKASAGQSKRTPPPTRRQVEVEIPLDDPAEETPIDRRPRAPRGAPLRQDRSPIKPLEEPFELPELPEPASDGQVLVALAKLDPLSQELMIAQRLASMPNPSEGGMPINIHRAVRGPWARQLRKLGIFCIPELATHELVANEDAGIMANHVGAKMSKITSEDLWNVAKQHSPQLAKLVEDADTPEKRAEAMRTLARKLPVEQRIAMEKLMKARAADLEPE